MEFTDVLDKVKELDEFKSMDEDFFLAHVFVNNYGETPWEIGFYNDDEELMKVFGGDPVRFMVEDEVLETDDGIVELNLEQVSHDMKDAKQVAEEEMEDMDMNGDVNKVMGILQHLDVHVWNLTFVTDALEVANIKVNAEDGSIYASRKDNLMNMTKFDQG